jgi:hypothetical protein
MTYYENIKNNLKAHLLILEKISEREDLPKKVSEHFDNTSQILNEIGGQKPENFRLLIEYINNESRRFGWSFPENSDEEKCETDFWKLKDSIKRIVQGMTANERLHFFGYLEEYENLKPIQRSERENIELKLFMR